MRIIERALERAGEAGKDYSIEGVTDGQTRGGAGGDTSGRRRVKGDTSKTKPAFSKSTDQFAMPTGVNDGDPMDFYDLSGLDLNQFSDSGDGTDVDFSNVANLADFDFSDAVDLGLQD